MAAVATKKPNGDFAVQLTFPRTFATFARDNDFPLGYFSNNDLKNTIELPTGDDFFSKNHEQKRIEAQKMALAAVQSKKNMNHRAFTSHAGYYKMPKPVLSQRIFANPSLGALELYSDRRTSDVDAPFNCVYTGIHGGVLFTRMGRKYAREILQRRSRDLDKINELANEAQGVNLPEVTDSGTDRNAVKPELPDKEMIDLVLRLQGIIDAVDDQDVSRFTMTDFSEFINLFIKFAQVADKTRLTEIVNTLQQFIENIQASLEQTEEEGKNVANITSLLSLWERITRYGLEMLANIDKPLDEKKIISKSLIEDLGIKKIARKPRAVPTTPAAPAGAVAPPAPAAPVPAADPAIRNHPQGVANDGFIYAYNTRFPNEIRVDGVSYSLPIRNSAGYTKAIKTNMPIDVRRQWVNYINPTLRLTTEKAINKFLFNVVRGTRL